MKYEDLLDGFPAHKRYPVPAQSPLNDPEVLERARKLLTDGWTVGATAVEIGYSSKGSFSDAFKRTTGVRPSTLGAGRGCNAR